MTEEKKSLEDEEPIPRWQRVVAVVYIIVAIALVVVFRSHLHEDFIPIDGSRVAPNILASFVIVIVMTPIAVLVWPPTRRRIHRFVDRKLAPIHTHLEHAHDHRIWEAQHTAEMFRQVTGREPEQHPHFDLQGGDALGGRPRPVSDDVQAGQPVRETDS